MLYGAGALLVVELCLVVYCVLNIITTPEDQVRNLPKMVWLVLALLFPIVGGVAWLVAGRPQGPARSVPYKGNAGRIPPEYDRPGRATASSPDDDEAFLRSLRERAEEQRRRAEQERRAHEADPDA
ncbi:MAG: PLDc_N domain-containing protein [Frankiales bacterium]|nr:MAG: PLDc_N domain-containing protein [Frankiales bacterium]